MNAYGYAYDENDAVRYLKEKDRPRAKRDAWLLIRFARVYQVRHVVFGLFGQSVLEIANTLFENREKRNI